MAGKNLSLTVGAIDESGAAFTSLQKNIEKTQGLLEGMKSTMASASTVDWAKSLVKDVAPARDTIAGLRVEISRVSKELESIPVGSSKFSAYAALSTHLRSELAAATSPLRDVNNGVQAMSSGFSRSGILAMNLGRVISDMPYGMLGIANNIEPLATSFAMAKEEAGGTKGAVQGLLASIASPTGLAMVGVPILASLAIAFGPNLVKAINSGSESVEDLKSRLQGIQQYQDFDLTIKIAGLEGVKKLKAELDQLIAKKSFLEDAQAADAKVSAVGQWNIVSAMTNPLAYGMIMQRQNEARTQADQKRTGFYKGTAQSIASGKISLGDDENVRLMSKYLGMSESAAMNLNATNKTNWDIASKQSQIDLAKAKEDAKGSKSKSTGTSGRSDAEAIQDEIYRVNKALEDMGKSGLPSVAVAAANVAKATESWNTALKGNDKEDVQNKGRALIDQQKTLKETTAFWQSASQKYNLDIAKNTEATLSVADAQKALAEANVAVKTALDAQDAKSYLEAIQNKEQAEIRVKKAIDASTKSLKSMNEAIQAIGSVVTNLGGNGTSVVSLLQGVSKLTNGVDTTGMTDAQAATAKTNNQVSAYSQIASAVGSTIGGKTGSAISNAANSGAAAFAMTGNPIVAAAFAVVSAVSSLFDSGPTAQDISNAQNASSSGWKAIDQLAASGSPTAQAMMARVGYNANSAAISAREGSFYGMGFDNLLGGTRDFGMFYTKENGYNQDVIAYLTTLEKIDSTIRSFASTSTAQKINEVNWKYEELIGLSGNLANAEKARMDELIVGVLGINADTVSTFISDAVSANATGAAGKAFSAKFEESVAAAIRNMAISNLVTNSIMPVLQPVMAQITTGLLSGTLSTSAMAGLMKQAAGVSKTISPMVTSLAQAFSAAGLMTSSSATTATASKSVSTSGYNSYVDYRRALAGVPAYASGGEFIAGENGPELVRISSGSARIYNNSDTRRMFDTSRLEGELRALREDIRAGQIAIAKNTARTFEIMRKFDVDGLPETRNYSTS